MKIAMIKIEGVLKPAYNHDVEEFAKLPEDFYIVHIKRSRNLEHHNKYWALIKLLADNWDGFISKDQVSTWLKYKVGEVDYVIRTGSEVIVQPKSISFESMSQDRFEEFWEKIIPIVAEKLGITREEIDENMVF